VYQKRALIVLDCFKICATLQKVKFFGIYLKGTLSVWLRFPPDLFKVPILENKANMIWLQYFI
jgi:hypothetical protein